jgi:hypothetical protein
MMLMPDATAYPSVGPSSFTTILMAPVPDSSHLGPQAVIISSKQMQPIVTRFDIMITRLIPEIGLPIGRILFLQETDHDALSLDQTN